MTRGEMYTVTPHVLPHGLKCGTWHCRVTGEPRDGAVVGRHIRPTPTRQGDAYPATLTRHIAAQEERMARAVAARHRLARFIRNPLNH